MTEVEELRNALACYHGALVLLIDAVSNIYAASENYLPAVSKDLKGALLALKGADLTQMTEDTDD